MTRSRQTADWGSRAGLAKVIPSSVAVGSGTGSASALGTVTFSGASSVSLNDVFSATYENYKVLVDISSMSADAAFYIKMRVSGSDNSSSYYNSYPGYTVASAGFNTTDNPTTSGFYLCQGDSGTNNQCGFTGDLCKPFLAVPTRLLGIASSGGSTGTYASQSGSGWHSVSTSYTSLTLLPNTGNITGTITVYGYN